jgi:phage recombination protein Bet
MEALQTTQHAILRQEDILILVQAGVIPANAPESQIRLFAKFCADSEFSPFKRQAHLVNRGDKWTIQTGIDGYRAKADRTGRYAGNDDYLFNQGMTEFQCIESKAIPPKTATAVVYKLIGGTRCAFSATARWEEYCPSADKTKFMWNKMPFLMLGKCAEALALRKAFPDELGGIYTDEEMQQAERSGKFPVVSDFDVEESLDQRLPSERVEVAHNATVVTFDPMTEEITFGKYKGMKWIEAPSDYLGWMSDNATATEVKNKALATLGHKKAVEQQQPDVLDEMFPGERKKAKDAIVDPPLIQVLQSELDEVTRKGDLAGLQAWGKENKERIGTLSEEEKAGLKKSFLAAKKSLKGA